MMQLRDYQEEAIDVIANEFKLSDRQYIEMPTGSGKTFTFLTYAKRYHKKVLIVVPSKELMRQTYESALNFYHKTEVSRKGDRIEEVPSNVHICIIASLKGKYLEFITKQSFDLVVVDEAHHVNAESYIRLINHMLFKPKILGVTATPDRLDGKFLTEILLKQTYKISMPDLIQKGYLSDLEGFTVRSKIDLSDVDSHNGEYSLHLLFKKVCTESRNKLVLDICRNHLTERKSIVFCVNIEHSISVCQILNENGIPAAHIDGRMNSEERNKIICALADGTIKVLTNCQLLTEGFDLPIIDGIVIARPTMSKSLFTQMIGRGLRIYPGKRNCRVIDIVDNKSLAQGFNSIVQYEGREHIDSFSSLKDLEEKVQQAKLKILEFKLEKALLLGRKGYEELKPTNSMIDYLKIHQISYFDEITFDEASFLIWLKELEKKFYGYNKKTQIG